MIEKEKVLFENEDEKEKGVKKFYVRLSVETVEKLDVIAKELGMTRSSLIAYYVGQGVNQEIKKNRLMDPDTYTEMIKDLGLVDVIKAFMPDKENNLIEFDDLSQN